MQPVQPATKFQERTIIFTVFNYGEDPASYLEAIKEKCDWVYGQLEKCPTTEKLHIQAMAYSKVNCKWGFVRAHKEKCFDPLASIKYCSKDESRVDGPWEFGPRPTWNKKGQKLTNMELIQGDLKTLVDENRIPLVSLPKIIKAREIYSNLKPIIMEEKVIKGTWHYGPPRTGKSTAARTGVYYLKSANKWWDGYNGEDKVVLEDVDTSMKEWLGYFLKIWTDWWAFRGEVKGSQIMIQIKEFHVTSNYSIKEIFGEDCDAIQVRFKTIHYSDFFKIK